MARRKRSEGESQEWVEERRAQILKSAAAVFARRGYHRARLQDVATEAGLATGSVYNYFDSKHDLLVALLHRMLVDSVPSALAQADEHDEPAAWLTAMLESRFDLLDRNRQLIEAVAPELIAHESLRRDHLDQVVLPLFDEFTPLLHKFTAGGQLRRFNPRVILPAIAGALIGAFAASDYSAMGYEKVTRDEVVAELRTFIMDGLRRPEPELELPLVAS